MCCVCAYNDASETWSLKGLQIPDLMAESAGVGAEEGFEMLLDSEQIRSIPVLGSMIEERSRKTVPRARRCAARAPILSSTIIHSHLT